MFTTVRITLFVCVLLQIGTLSHSAVVLDENASGSVLGGCSNYCYDYSCGSNTPCKKAPDGTCDPSNPATACDNLEIYPQQVDNCGRLTPNGNKCTQGDAVDCGQITQCYCQWKIFGYYCEWSGWPYAGYAYWPCLV